MCESGSTFLKLRREPGDRTSVEGVKRPPVSRTASGSCACAWTALVATMQTSRETFADSLRNSVFTVGEGSRQVYRWGSAAASAYTCGTSLSQPVSLPLTFTAAGEAPKIVPLARAEPKRTRGATMYVLRRTEDLCLESYI